MSVLDFWNLDFLKTGEYLLRKVLPEEYEALKAKRQEIISDSFEHFNDVWKPRVQGIQVNFKYNPEKFLIGIFVNEKGRDPVLALDKEGLTEEMDAVAGSLYLRLEERLRRIRLPKENWIE